MAKKIDTNLVDRRCIVKRAYVEPACIDDRELIAGEILGVKDDGILTLLVRLDSSITRADGSMTSNVCITLDAIDTLLDPPYGDSELLDELRQIKGLLSQLLAVEMKR